MSFIPAYGFRAAGDVKFNHDSLCSLYVGLPGYICDHSGESIRHGSYGSVDRYVYGLDSEVHYLYGKVQKPQMAGSQGYLMVFRCCLIRKSMKKRSQC